MLYKATKKLVPKKRKGNPNKREDMPEVIVVPEDVPESSKKRSIMERRSNPESSEKRSITVEPESFEKHPITERRSSSIEGNCIMKCMHT